MAKASKEIIAELENRFNSASQGLEKVTEKKMFGCHALFANGNVFGLVWKEGRLGVRLPDESKFEELMAQKGAVPWKAGTMTMSHWVLVPQAMHEDTKTLRRWLQSAHSLALNSEGTAKGKKPSKRKASSARGKA